MDSKGDVIVESPVEARGGFLDRPVAKVLIASCVLAIIALALLWGGFFASH